MAQWARGWVGFGKPPAKLSLGFSKPRKGIQPHCWKKKKKEWRIRFHSDSSTGRRPSSHHRHHWYYKPHKRLQTAALAAVPEAPRQSEPSELSHQDSELVKVGVGNLHLARGPNLTSIPRTPQTCSESDLAAEVLWVGSGAAQHPHQNHLPQERGLTASKRGSSAALHKPRGKCHPEAHKTERCREGQQGDITPERLPLFGHWFIAKVSELLSYIWSQYTN